MNSMEIQKALTLGKIKAKSVGVFAADRVPVILERPAAIVVNTDIHTKPGTHWIALYIDKYGYGSYFDSYGMPPLVSHHITRIKQNCKKIVWNQNQLQGFNTRVCGQYSIIFLHHISRGISLSKFCKLFTKSSEKNDCLILKMYKKLIKEKKELYKRKRNVSNFPNDNSVGSGLQTCKSLL